MYNNTSRKIKAFARVSCVVFGILILLAGIAAATVLIRSDSNHGIIWGVAAVIAAAGIDVVLYFLSCFAHAYGELLELQATQVNLQRQILNSLRRQTKPAEEELTETKPAEITPQTAPVWQPDQERYDPPEQGYTRPPAHFEPYIPPYRPAYNPPRAAGNYSPPRPAARYAAPQQGYTAPQQGCAAPQQGYTAPQQGYTAPQQGYAVPQQQGYTAPQQQGYAAPQQQGYAAPPKQPYRTKTPYGTASGLNEDFHFEVKR